MGGEPRRLDEVSIFDGKLTFLIPHEWIEVEAGDDGTYLYQEPHAESGWFRVSLITSKNRASPAARLQELFNEYGNVEVDETTGNLIRWSEKDLVEDGHRLHIFYWFVRGSVPPDIVREAVFSYTVLADFLNNDKTQSDVALIARLIERARFCPVDEEAVE